MGNKKIKELIESKTIDLTVKLKDFWDPTAVTEKEANENILRNIEEILHILKNETISEESKFKNVWLLINALSRYINSKEHFQMKDIVNNAKKTLLLEENESNTSITDKKALESYTNVNYTTGLLEPKEIEPATQEILDKFRIINNSDCVTKEIIVPTNKNIKKKELEIEKISKRKVKELLQSSEDMKEVLEAYTGIRVPKKRSKKSAITDSK
jgi:hypothetical protein